MGSSIVIKILIRRQPILILLLLLLQVIFIFSESDIGLLQQTSMTLYIHNYWSGPNATVSPILGIQPDCKWANDNFGTMFCTDNPITEDLDQDSGLVGRAQGIYMNSAQDGTCSRVFLSLVFSVEEYEGSTLEIQGASSQVERVREVSVVAGTGKFRFSRGYATFETVYFDTLAAYSVTECNIILI